MHREREPLVVLVADAGLERPVDAAVELVVDAVVQALVRLVQHVRLLLAGTRVGEDVRRGRTGSARRPSSSRSSGRPTSPTSGPRRPRPSNARVLRLVLREARNRRDGILHRHPDEAVALLGAVGDRAGPGRDRRPSGERGDAHAGAAAPYSQPWYGQTMRPSRTQPSDSAAPRWMQRSLKAATPSAVRNATSCSPSSVKACGWSVSSVDSAIGCQYCESRVVLRWRLDRPLLHASLHLRLRRRRRAARGAPRRKYDLARAREPGRVGMNRGPARRLGTGAAARASIPASVCTVRQLRAVPAADQGQRGRSFARPMPFGRLRKTSRPITRYSSGANRERVERLAPPGGGAGPPGRRCAASCAPGRRRGSRRARPAAPRRCAASPARRIRWPPRSVARAPRRPPFHPTTDAVKTTLPLWMYDATSPQPASVKMSRRSVMRIFRLPPTLIPRRRAT